MNVVLLDYGSLGCDVDLSPFQSTGNVTAYEMTTPDQVEARIQDADVVITNKLKLNRSNLDAATHLKQICVTATGYDNIDLNYCAERGIAVCNVPGYSTDSVAQLTLAMAFALSTHLIAYRNHVNGGFYSRSGSPNLLSPVWHELTGKVWGIVGCGNIGRKVARVAQAMGCKVLVFRRSADPEFEMADLDTLLQRLAQAEPQQNAEFINIFYGEDVTEGDAEKAMKIFQEACPSAEVSLLPGGQPVYYYMISAE